MLHHLKKSRPDATASPELTDLSWSGFAEHAGSWILLSRRTPFEPNAHGRHELWLVTGGRTGHFGKFGLDAEEGLASTDAGRYWHPEIFDASEIEAQRREQADAARDAKLAQRIEGDAAKVVRAMGRYPDGETPKAIRDAAGLSGTHFAAAVAKLVDDGHIAPCEVRKSNHRTPYEGYKLAEGDNP
jgi:hypothetical protein